MSSVSKKEELSEIIARNMGAMKKLQEAMAACEKAKRDWEIQRKVTWQLSELARIKEGSKMKSSTIFKGGQAAGYGGYLDGYSGSLL
jgi:hypothetical protein